MTPEIDTTTISQEISIDASPADIFTLLTELNTLLDTHPETTVVTTEEGTRVTCTGGKDSEPPVSFDVQFQVTETEKPTALTIVFSGTIQGSAEWILQPRDDSTLVTATITSTLPPQSIEAVVAEVGIEADGAGVVSPSTIKTMISTEIDTILADLQLLSEQQPPPAAMARVDIPEITSPFPNAVSPHLEAVTSHTRDWAQQAGIPEIADPSSGLADLPRLTCLSHPHASQDALCVCSDWYSLAFHLDDYFDTTERGADPSNMDHFQQPLLAVFEQDQQKSHDEPMVRAFADIWNRVIARAPSVWQERFAQHHHDSLAAHQWEAHNRATNNVPDRSTYIQKRRLTGGMFPSFDLVELANDVYLSHADYQNGPVVAFHEAAANVVGWTNDVYSLQRELEHKEVNNFVVVVRHDQRCSLQAAITEVRELIDAEIHRLEALGERLTASSGEDNTLTNHQTAIKRWTQGQLKWINESSRYSPSS